MNLYRITYSIQGAISNTRECLLATDLRQAKETFERYYSEFQFVSAELDSTKVHECPFMPGVYNIDEGENENSTPELKEQYKENLVSLCDSIRERIQTLKHIEYAGYGWSKIRTLLFGQSNGNHYDPRKEKNPDAVIQWGSKLNRFD